MFKFSLTKPHVQNFFFFCLTPTFNSKTKVSDNSQKKKTTFNSITEILNNYSTKKTESKKKKKSPKNFKYHVQTHPTLRFLKIKK